MADPTTPQSPASAGTPAEHPSARRASAAGTPAEEGTTEGSGTTGTSRTESPGTDTGAPRTESIGTAPPPKKSRYSMSAGDLSLRNMIWALALTIGVVAVVAMVFYGVGRPVDREIPESQKVDVAASAERAQAEAPYRVAAPQLPSRWEPRDARFTGGDAPQWRVQYTTPAGSLATLTQVPEASATVLNSLAPGASGKGSQKIAGHECEVLQGQEAATSTVLVCHGKTWDMVITGRDDAAALRPLADAAIGSVSR